jgi:hypothetical protein
MGVRIALSKGLATHSCLWAGDTIASFAANQFQSTLLFGLMWQICWGVGKTTCGRDIGRKHAIDPATKQMLALNCGAKDLGLTLKGLYHVT